MDTCDNGVPGIYKHAREKSIGNNNNLELTSQSITQKHRNSKRLDLFRDLNCAENVHQHFHSFAENVSIDGIKFVGEKDRSIVERIFWVLSLTIAVYLCIVLVVQTFQKWIKSPVIVTFATSETAIFEIPFPAVTVCPEDKSNKTLFNYTDIYLRKDSNQNLTSDEDLHFNYMSLICNPPRELFSGNKIINNSSSLILFLKSIAPYFDIYELEWRGEQFKFDRKNFTPILTSAGVCYTFNLMDRSEIFTDIVSFPEPFFSSNVKTSMWSPEKGYSEEAGIDSYPRRTMVASAEGGLSFRLNAFEENFDYTCDSLRGFKISLHHPGEIPQVKQNYFKLPLNQSVTVFVKPNIITTSEDLRTYSPKDRKCYFTEEKQLRFFKVYSQQNCLLECLTNFTLNNCGCVNFHMPKEESTPICSAISKVCMDGAKVLFLKREVMNKIKQSRKSAGNDLDMKDIDYANSCNCLPSCISLNYDVATSQSDWNWSEELKVWKQTSDWNKYMDKILNSHPVHPASISIFFKEMQFLTSERNEWQGYTDFWANIGGIIGLFTGFSFITMFEMLYYLSLRICCNVRMYGRRYWSGLPE